VSVRRGWEWISTPKRSSVAGDRQWPAAVALCFAIAHAEGAVVQLNLKGRPPSLRGILRRARRTVAGFSVFRNARRRAQYRRIALAATSEAAIDGGIAAAMALTAALIADLRLEQRRLERLQAPRSARPKLEPPRGAPPEEVELQKRVASLTQQLATARASLRTLRDAKRGVLRRRLEASLQHAALRRRAVPVTTARVQARADILEALLRDVDDGEG